VSTLISNVGVPGCRASAIHVTVASNVGEELPPAQQHAETAEFESRVGCCRARPARVVPQRISSPSAGLSAYNLARVRASVATVNERLLCGKHKP